jgi:hypothetical protein
MGDRYYVSKCPNCASRDRDRVIYRCTRCKHEGCFHHNLLSPDVGCWKGKSCPRCEATYQATKIVANIR